MSGKVIVDDHLRGEQANFKITLGQQTVIMAGGTDRPWPPRSRVGLLPDDAEPQAFGLPLARKIPEVARDDGKHPSERSAIPEVAARVAPSHLARLRNRRDLLIYCCRSAIEAVPRLSTGIDRQ